MEQILDPILQSPQFILARQLCTLFFIVFSIALIFWTWRDARKRGAMSWFWALVVLIFNLAGWAVYMVVRPPEYLDDVRERALEIRAKEASLKSQSDRCPACLRSVEQDFLVCPNCMKTLRKSCVECDRALEIKWNVCPYCKAKQGQSDQEEPTPRRRSLADIKET
jgi:RNA polymerase subunit RPABC4/transcription elongation factor Spt4